MKQVSDKEVIAYHTNFLLLHFAENAEDYSLFHGFWQSFFTIGSYNHLMKIISTYVGNTEK